MLLSTAGDCPSTPEGWNHVEATLSSSEIAVTPELVQLKAAVVHIDVTAAKFSFGPATLRPVGKTGKVHAEPIVQMNSGIAKIGQKTFDLRGGDGHGNFNGSFASTEFGGIELTLSEMRVVFNVDVDEIEGDTKIIIQVRAAALQPASVHGLGWARGNEGARGGAGRGCSHGGAHAQDRVEDPGTGPG